MGFQQNRPIAFCQGHAVDFVQQNGLADTPQAREQQAFFRTLDTNSPQEHPRLLENTFASGQFRQWGACAGGKWISDVVH
jgi:hypothetical protein